MADTFERIKKRLVDRMHCDADKVTMEASFVDDLNLDSLDTVEVIMQLEEEFGVYIDDDEAEKMNTVGDAVKHIEASRVVAA